MNGAQALVRTLLGSGVDVCFTNPGTSEMHAVAALDDVPAMRAVLGLFEGVVTGAADGYARMTGRPAAVLLHLGPGLGNGLANLHNANRAGVPVVALVGDHATSHQGLRAPLESDIETVARNVGGWVRSAGSAAGVGGEVARAVAASRTGRGRIATLLLPADSCWGEGGEVAAPIAPPPRTLPSDETVTAVAALLDGGSPTALLLGGEVLADAASLATATAIAERTGTRLLAETFPTRLVRGAGIAPIDLLAYRGERAREQLVGCRDLVLLGADEPVTFFAYPGQPSRVPPPGCGVHVLATPDDDGRTAIDALAAELDVTAAPPPTDARRPAAPTGPLDARAAALAIGALLPEGAIVVDEAVTSKQPVPAATAGAPPHDVLALTGGSIGFGLPAAVGAAVAAPDRKVVALQADGSAMYTIQSLWTMAREQLDVTIVLYNNASYEILRLELAQVGAIRGGERANRLFDLTDPTPDFTAIAHGFGVPAMRATTADELTEQLERSLADDGPALVEAMIPGIV